MGSPVAVAGAAAVFVGLLAGAEVATRRRAVDAELSRKFVHVSSGVVAAALPLVMGYGDIVVLSAGFVPFLLAARCLRLFPAVSGVERSTLGEVWFPLGVLLAAALFPDGGPYVYGVLVMGLADAAASLWGRRAGRRRYRVPGGGHKTWAGSAAFLGTTVVVGVAVLGVADGWTARTLAAAVLAAVPLTVAEGVLGRGTDNLVLPVAAAALLSLGT